MDMLRLMEVFVRVAEAGSLSEAARQMNVTVSAVSKQVASLEADLGAALVIRHARGLALTEAGANFARRAAAALAEVRAARDSVRREQDAPRGLLRVTAPVSFGRSHVSPHLPGFLAANPGVTVELQSGAALVDLVAEGYDVAVRIGELRDSALVAARLAPSNRVLCASPAYLGRFGVPDAPGSLFKHACLINTLYTKRNTWFFSRDDETVPVTVAGSFQTDNSDALVAAALEGVGLILLGTWIVGPYLRDGHLVRVLPGWRVDVTPGQPGIHAVYPRMAFPSPKVRAFVDFLRNAYGRPPYWEHP